LAIMLLFIALYSVEQWSKVPLLPTAGWWIAFAVFLLLCFISRPRINGKPYRIPIISVFFALVALTSVYGAAFKAENYWDWKNLVGNILIFLLPIASYTYSQPKVLSKSVNAYMIISCILVIPVAFFTTSDAMGRFLAPYCLMALFLPCLGKRSALMVIIAFAILLGIMLIFPNVRRVFLSTRKAFYLILMICK